MMNWNCAIRNEDEASSLVESNVEALHRVSGSIAPDPPLVVVRNAPYVRFVRVRAAEVRAMAIRDQVTGGDVFGGSSQGDVNEDDCGNSALDDGLDVGGGYRSMLEEADLAGGRRSTGTLRLAVRPERDEGYHNVGSLQELPSEMRGKVSLRRMGRAGGAASGSAGHDWDHTDDDRLATFIDYGHLLTEAGSRLKPRLKGPYMARLRRHLISVRAALDEVERWLDASDEDVEFLERMTGVEGLRARLEEGMDRSDGAEFECLAGFYSDEEPCMGCGKEYRAHLGVRRRCPVSNSLNGNDSNGGSGSSDRSSDGPSNDKSHVHREKDDDMEGRNVFRCKSRWILLKDFRNVPLDLLPDGTKTSLTFRLPNDDDRTGLAELASRCSGHT